jgi:hypothetical protein
MPHRVSWLCVGLLGSFSALAVAASAPPAAPQGDKPQKPLLTHAFNFKCRSAKLPTFKEARAFGVEAFKDKNTNLGLYLIETGCLALTPDGFGGITEFIKNSKSPVWKHGMDVRCRSAGMTDFAKAQTFTIEVYFDLNTNNWIYVTDRGYIAVAPGKSSDGPTAGALGPLHLYGLDLKCRKGGKKDFNDPDVKIWGVEIFRDQNTGFLIYLAESGAISVVPGFDTFVAPAKIETPDWLHGLDLKCRKGKEEKFATAQVYGLELFRDGNNSNYIYISEVGSIAALRGDKNVKAPTPKDTLKQPQARHGLDLKCRTFDEKEFSDKTKVHGVEIYVDPNVNTMIHIVESGHIAAVSTK